MMPITASDLELVKSPEMFKFLMVRHPFTRILSAYNDRINKTSKNWSRRTHVPHIIQLFGYTNEVRKQTEASETK